jgi:hypothetical protein
MELHLRRGIVLYGEDEGLLVVWWRPLSGETQSVERAHTRFDGSGQLPLSCYKFVVWQTGSSQTLGCRPTGRCTCCALPRDSQRAVCDRVLQRRAVAETSGRVVEGEQLLCPATCAARPRRVGRDVHNSRQAQGQAAGGGHCVGFLGDCFDDIREAQP